MKTTLLHFRFIRLFLFRHFLLFSYEKNSHTAERALWKWRKKQNKIQMIMK